MVRENRLYYHLKRLDFSSLVQLLVFEGVCYSCFSEIFRKNPKKRKTLKILSFKKTQNSKMVRILSTQRTIHIIKNKNLSHQSISNRQTALRKNVSKQTDHFFCTFTQYWPLSTYVDASPTIPLFFNKSSSETGTLSDSPSIFEL